MKTSENFLFSDVFSGYRKGISYIPLFIHSSSIVKALENDAKRIIDQHFLYIYPNRSKAVKSHTAQKIKFSIKDFFSKCDQIGSFLRIWSHLLKKSLMDNFFFVQCKSQLLHLESGP